MAPGWINQRLDAADRHNQEVLEEQNRPGWQPRTSGTPEGYGLGAAMALPLGIGMLLVQQRTIAARLGGIALILVGIVISFFAVRYVVHRLQAERAGRRMARRRSDN